MEETVSAKERLGLKKSYGFGLFKLFATAAIGIVIFFVSYEGTPVFNTLYNTFFLKTVIGPAAPFIIGLIPPLMLIGNIIGKHFAKEGSFIYRYFENDKLLHRILYIVATIYSIVFYFGLNVPVLNLLSTPEVGGVMMDDILKVVIAISPIAAAALPLLADYGLLNVVGGLLEPLMRPVWKAPGKSALDMVTSIVGAAVIGIMLTSNLYKRNEYTNREAFYIATSFSLNSVGACTFIITACGLLHYFGSMFIIYFVITFLMAIVMVRIPPISRYPDVYADGTVQTDEMRKENLRFSLTHIKNSVDAGVQKADGTGFVGKDILKGFVSGCKIVTTLVPMMMAIGCTGLMVANFTPILEWISMPLVPIISLLGIEEAGLASQAILLGGVDVVLPSALISTVTNEATRFFVCTISLVQVLYISETMLPVYFFGIPCKFRHIVIAFFERTAIAIPIVAGITHLMFNFVY